jgi:PE family
MSLLIAASDVMVDAAADLANIGSTLNAAHLMAATPTVAVVPAAADEVSVNIANLFSVHAQDYQALAGQAAGFHKQFAQRLTSSAAAYSNAEAANVTLLQILTAGAETIVNALVAFGKQLVEIFDAIVSQLPGLLVTLAEATPAVLAVIALSLSGIGILLLVVLGGVFLAALAL